MSTTIGESYTGPWINYSKGWILGSTITLSARSGGLLTSFLAAFITVVAAQLWRIISFTIHQLRASNKNQDGLHHQHQIVFRNTTSPGGATWTFIQQYWAWRNKARHAFLRSIPWAILSTTFIIAFGVLSIFSAEVTKAAGIDRLVRSDRCGYFRLSTDSPDANTALLWKTLNDSINAASYARTCYGGVADQLQCGSMYKPSLPYTINGNATCPFESGMCLYGNTAAYSMDSGLIDSRDDLGINSPDSGRIQFRKVSTCAPITSKKFVVTTENNATSSLILDFGFGPLDLGGPTLQNSTFSYNTVGILTNSGYTVNTIYANAGSGDNFWFPVEQLNRTDADVTLVFIMPNAIYFEAKNQDPVFSANLVYTTEIVDGKNVTYYTADHYVGIIACADQYQFCSPVNGKCTPLSGLALAINPPKMIPMLSPLGLFQEGVLDRLSSASFYTSMYQAISSRGSGALRAQETVSQLQQAALPNTQWQIEVSAWFASSLARLQRTVLEYATGPSNILPGSYIWTPPDLISRAMCSAQLIRSTDATISFSVLGVAIILIVGVIIVFVSLILEPLVQFLQDHFFKDSRFRFESWIADDKFQLQRMMFEGRGLGGVWNGKTDYIPTTEPGEVFGGWEISNGHMVESKLEHGAAHGLETPDEAEERVQLMVQSPTK